MSKIKQGLGRGLDALINSQNYFGIDEERDTQDIKKETRNETEVISKLPVSKISPNPFQPRKNFDPEALNSLKKSIIANGLIQPITVRRNSLGNYELISGERRLRACSEIGYSEIPAYILDVVSDEIMLAMALIENIQRERLNPIEIGAAYKRLMEECSLTQEQIAERVGKDRSTVANSIRLLKLPPEIQNALIIDEISMGHARALINLPSPSMQIAILKKIKDGSLNVRKVELLVKKMLLEESSTRKIASVIKGKPDSANLNAVEDRLRRLFGTKVICKQKTNGAGEFIIEFYSLDELERLIEIFDTIEKYNN